MSGHGASFRSSSPALALGLADAHELGACHILSSSGQLPAVEAAAFLAAKENFDWAADNELEGALALRVAERFGWEEVPPYWRTAYATTGRRIAAYLDELDRVAGLLADNGIKVVALKNAGIARGIYPYLGACPMGDLDVLVEKQHFRAAHTILLGEGYCFEFRSPLEEASIQQAEAGGGAEYRKTLANGDTLWLELQWRPVAGRWIRPDQEPPASDLVARSLAIPGSAVRLLAPEDNLLQVALHTAKHSYVRAPGFRLHLDVERIVSAYPALDWNRFLAQAVRLRVKTAVYFSLAIPSALLGTPVPPEVLAALRPRAWHEGCLARLIGQAGLFNPRRPKFGRLEYLLFAALLYDEAGGLWRSILPSPSWMRERYAVRHAWLLPAYYGRRLFDLALRRAKT
jgi:hypothetical protein